jgi:hypothetical protein
MNDAPEVMKPAKRCYGMLLSLLLDECGHDWMFAQFPDNGDVTTWEVPESELFTQLTRHLMAAAKARLAGARDRQLTIWRHEDGSWQVSS